MNFSFIEQQEVALLDSLLQGIENLNTEVKKSVNTKEYDQIKEKATLQGQIDALASMVLRLEERIDSLEIENQKLKNRLS